MTILSTVIARGLDAAKPADPPVGSIYFATDAQTLERWNGTTWETFVPAPSGGGGGAAGAPLIVGRLYDVGSFSGGDVGTLALVANRLHAGLITLGAETDIDRLAAQVTASATGTLRLGVYAVGTNGLPGALVVDSGDVALSGTGFKSATVAATLNAGPYYLALVASATPTVTTITTTDGVRPLGTADGGLATTDLGQNGVYRDLGGYGALPDPFGAITDFEALRTPRVAFRVASS